MTAARRASNRCCDQVTGLYARRQEANLFKCAPDCCGRTQGKITVKEQRNKLLYELDRTVNKSAQAGA